MNKSVFVAGCGKSGVQAANLLLRNGDSVILYDGDTGKDKEALKAQLSGEAEIVLGELEDALIDRISYCIISPGISTEVPFAVKLREAGIDIRSEIEASCLFEKGSVIGITGTNGKTTTTSLVGAVMAAYKGEGRAFTVGNIGIPYAEKVMETSEDSVTTIELSSFQLETVRTFHPHVSAILNITPDHLNRHHTMEAYAEAKGHVAMNQTAEDFCVLNYEDARLRTFSETVRARVLWFSGRRELADGYYLKDGILRKAVAGVSEDLMTVEETHLVGLCNYENILAAIAISEAMGVPMDVILGAVREFRAVPHRIEFVREVNGVRYYNDSKGTNPDAAIQGIRAMTSKTVLIGGGYDKGSEYDEWIEAFGGKVRKLLLLGQTREKIAACCERNGFTDYEFVDSLQEAVSKAAALTLPGEAVLLSPACASWGMFQNYEERGDIFKQLVRDL